MATVKAHAAEDSAHAAYCYRLKKFYTLQVTLRNCIRAPILKQMSTGLSTERGPCYWCAAEGGTGLCIIHDHQYIPAKCSQCCCPLLRRNTRTGWPYERWCACVVHAVPAVTRFCVPGELCFIASHNHLILL